jgi:putative restriction endonuclease
MSRAIVFGEIEGIYEGFHFDSRKEMMPSSFHRNWAAGIDGNARDGAAAIVLSGGYEDDEDLGEEIIYTGAGGNDPNTGKQIDHQAWDNRGNAGLIKSMNDGLPVRVIRGYNHESEDSPSSGYTYAGLYSIVEAWQEIGKSGFKICRFRLLYSGGNISRRTAEDIEKGLDHSARDKRRTKGTVIRIIRDTKLAHDIKRLYNFKCQVCGESIPTKHGYYAEGAHIKPLGRPHDGDDSLANLLCLCPNHHVMLDKGAFSITDNLELIGSIEGNLIVDSEHMIDRGNLAYHRTCHGYD